MGKCHPVQIHAAQRENRKLVSLDSKAVRNGVEKHRIVISVFDEPLTLMAALKALTTLGFTAADLCVCGTIDTLSMAESVLHNSASINPALVKLFIHTEPYQATNNSQTIACSKGSLLSTLSGLTGKRQQDDSNRACADDCIISSELVAHIEQGQLVLMVDVGEPQQLVRASKVVLKFSPHIVHTHEFLLN